MCHWGTLQGPSEGQDVHSKEFCPALVPGWCAQTLAIACTTGPTKRPDSSFRLRRGSWPDTGQHVAPWPHMPLEWRRIPKAPWQGAQVPSKGNRLSPCAHGRSGQWGWARHPGWSSCLHWCSCSGQSHGALAFLGEAHTAGGCRLPGHLLGMVEVPIPFYFTGMTQALSQDPLCSSLTWI